MYNKNGLLALIILTLVSNTQTAGSQITGSHSSSGFSIVEEDPFIYAFIYRTDPQQLKNNPWGFSLKKMSKIYYREVYPLTKEVKRLVKANLENEEDNQPLHIIAAHGTLKQAIIATRIMFNAECLSEKNKTNQTPYEMAIALQREDIAQVFKAQMDRIYPDDISSSDFSSLSDSSSHSAAESDCSFSSGSDFECDSDCDCGNETCEQ